MPFFDVNFQYVTLLMLSAGVSPACGARIEIDSSGSGGNANQGTKIDGAGAILDAGPLHDAAYCSRQSACANDCSGMCNRNLAGTLNIVDCGIQLKSSPKDAYDVMVYVDCNLVLGPGPYYGEDAGLMLNPQGWTIDYSISPARLVFGAALCEQLQSMQGVPIYVYMGGGCIN